jgi:signal peptide peptidase SppA
MNEHSLVRVMTALVTEPWLITPSMHKTLCDIVTAHVNNSQTQHALAATMPQNPSPRQFAVAGDNVAVIPVDGVIGRKFSSTLYSSGVTSVDVLARLIDLAANDEEVNAILMVYDSPGGTVQGIAECANAINRARAIKPVLAYADGQCCSAAYWLASQSNAVYAWAEANVGSIGVYSAFLDRSREMEMAGIKPVIFKSGEHKAMGFAGTSLTEKERAMIQARVDEIGVKFRSAVSDGRHTTFHADVMQGQSFTAAESMANGLIDTITDFGTALSDAGKLGRIEKQKKEGKQ